MKAIELKQHVGNKSLLEVRITENKYQVKFTVDGRNMSECIMKGNPHGSGEAYVEDGYVTNNLCDEILQRPIEDFADLVREHLDSLAEASMDLIIGGSNGEFRSKNDF